MLSIFEKIFQSASHKAPMKTDFDYFCGLLEKINPFKMKRISLLLVLALSTMFAMAQNGRIELRSTSSTDITHSDFHSLRATFNYGSIESIEVNTSRGTFSEIAIEGTYASGELGTPELPVSHQLLAVPFGATPRVNVLSYSTTDYRLADYGIGTILPHQPSVRKDQEPEDVEFVYNAAAYSTRSLATAPEATIEVQGTLRGVRVGSLVINPVSYNPASNTLRVFNNIEVEVSFDGADIAETERMLLSTYTPYYNDVYSQLFNYRQIMDVYDDHPDLLAYPVHMIVIAPDSYISTLQPWINWKIQKGFYTDVYTTSQTGTTYSAIRSYVQNLYNTGVNQGATPTFLVLVGDTGQIPGTTGSSTSKVTDLYYGSVDGDYFPDMFYSRMSAENTTQLTNIINKIMQYEQYTMPDPTYLNKVLLIAGEDSSWNPRVGQPTINYATTYYYNAAHGFTNVYAYLNSYSGCYNNLSTGVGFANYTAHGSETGWSGPSFSNSNVNSLTNANKYFLAMGNCCLTGNFGYSSACFGETMIRAENKGAYSYIGSCPVTYWYEDYYFGVGATTVMSQTPTQQNTATGVYDGIWMDNTYHTVSSIVFLGNLAVCYAHAGNYQTSSSPTYYWQAYHVLGDGSIMPYRVNPSPNNVSHAAEFPAGATSFTVSAQEGSYVAISQNNVLKGVALVPAAGTVDVPVESGITSGQVRIVVTKPQRQPYIQDINVGNLQSEYTITVSANPTVGGTVTGGGTFPTGSTRTVTATANTGYTFINWTENGNVVSTSANYTFTLTYNRNLVANFEGQTFTITATSNPAEGGSVTMSGNRETYTYGWEDGTTQGWTVTSNDNGSTTWAVGQNGYNPGGNSSTVYTSHTGNYYIGSVYDESNAVDDWLISPQFLLGGNMSFYIKITNTDYTDYYSVLLSTGSSNINQFTTTLVPTTQVTSTTYTLVSVDLSSYSGQGYVAIRHTAIADQASLLVDDITIVEGVDPSNASGTFYYGQTCTVTATPNTGYHFVNWTENGAAVSSNANYSFTVTSNRNLVANFSNQTQTYTVNVSANPTQGGTVTGGGTFSQGQSCTVSATANTGYTFTNWTENGNVVSTNANYTFNVTSNRTLVANFTAQTFTITATANPTNGGTASGGGTYTYGQSCTLTATPATGYTFLRWTKNGQQVSTNATYTFTVTESAAYVAQFQQQTYTVALSANPSNGGTVSGGGTYAYGQSCTASATASNGYTFTNWTENGNVVSTNASYTFTVTSNRTLVANFTQQSYTITATADPANGGTVSGGGTYNYGQSCTLTATPASGYTFINWTKNGQQVSTNATYTFTVTASESYVAHFQQQSYTVSVSANPTNGGSVTGGGTFTYGQSCTVSATAASGFTFINWTENGSYVSSDATFTFTVTANRNLVANFTSNPLPNYTITVAAKPANGGTVIGGGIYQQGQSCTVRATPAVGYTFDSWKENDVVVSTEPVYTFTVTCDRNLVAQFNEIAYLITATANPAEGGTVIGGGTYYYGDEATLKVETNEDYIFQNWTENGVVVSEEQAYTFTVTGDRNLVANLLHVEGVGEQAGVVISLYPNPVSDKLTVEANEAIGHLEVFSITGALVYSQRDCSDKVEINTADLPAGIYFIRMTNDKMSETRRFVKK